MKRRIFLKVSGASALVPGAQALAPTAPATAASGAGHAGASTQEEAGYRFFNGARGGLHRSRGRRA